MNGAGGKPEGLDYYLTKKAIFVELSQQADSVILIPPTIQSIEEIYPSI
jgi:hypothetical protein